MIESSRNPAEISRVDWMPGALRATLRNPAALAAKSRTLIECQGGGYFRLPRAKRQSGPVSTVSCRVDLLLAGQKSMFAGWPNRSTPRRTFSSRRAIFQVETTQKGKRSLIRPPSRQKRQHHPNTRPRVNTFSSESAISPAIGQACKWTCVDCVDRKSKFHSKRDSCCQIFF